MIFSTWQANFKAILTTRQTAAAAATYSYYTSYDNNKYTQNKRDLRADSVLQTIQSELISQHDSVGLYPPAV